MNNSKHIPTKILAICITATSLCFLGCSSSVKPPVTVKQVNLNQYIGKWYEIASFPNYFQKGCQCTTATYGLLDSRVSVLNQCYRGNPLKLSSAHGKAWPIDSTNSQLKVQFFWPFRGDYWILYVDKAYRVALVGSPNYNYLWILSRTPSLSHSRYQQLVSMAKENGYDTQKLNLTKQDCS